MSLRRRARLAACAAGGLLWAGTAQAADREIARVGTPAVLAGAAKSAELKLSFDLPAGARQGPDQWYVVRLHYRLRFAPGSGAGFAWVTSETNGRTSAQVEYTTSRRGFRRTTVDLLHGQRERRSRSPRDEVSFTNYVQYQGVRAGTNTWTVRLEQAGNARVERLEVLADTAIVATDRTPFPLVMTVALDGERPEAGEPFTLIATLAARPGRTIDDVVVRAVRRPDAGLEPVGAAEQRAGRVGGRPRIVRFTFRARRAGSQTITLEADSAANDPNADVRVQILPATSATSTSPLVWGLAALPALAMLGWLARSRRRRRYAVH